MDSLELDAFKKKALALLESANPVYPWLDRAGDLIQCPPSALCRGDFYVMGFNPGGEDGCLLRDTLRKLEIDETQSHPLKGWGRGWSRLKDLATELEIEHWEEKLLITNLFPDKSSKIDDGSSKINNDWKKNHRDRPIPEYVRDIWRVHELMLSLVHPRFIISYGNGHKDSTFRFLWDFFEKLPPKAWNRGDIMPLETRKCDPTIKCFDIENPSWDPSHRVTVIGIRHLSYPSQSKYPVLKQLIDSKRR